MLGLEMAGVHVTQSLAHGALACGSPGPPGRLLCLWAAGLLRQDKTHAWDQPGLARGQMGTQPGYWEAEALWTRVALAGSLAQLSSPRFVLIVAKQHSFFFFCRQSMQGMNSYLI